MTVVNSAFDIGVAVGGTGAVARSFGLRAGGDSPSVGGGREPPGVVAPWAGAATAPANPQDWGTFGNAPLAMFDRYPIDGEDVDGWRYTCVCVCVCGECTLVS
jgi:hypothetical protein